MGNTFTNDKEDSDEMDVGYPEKIEEEPLQFDLNNLQPIKRDGRIFCPCGNNFSSEYIYSIHAETTNSGKCKFYDTERRDSTGWTQRMVNLVPYANDCQRGVIDHGKTHGLFVPIQLEANFDHAELKSILSRLPRLTKKISEEYNEPIVSVVGITSGLWKKWDPKPPKHLKKFTEIKVSMNDGGVVFPESGEDLFLFVKSNRIDLCNMLTSRVLVKIRKVGLKRFSQTIGFANDPTKDQSPNMGRDLTGFVDGTRNPDHLLRALIDQCLVFPGDDDGNHVGGSYMYAGKFIHNLEKFHGFSNEEKSQIIGRDISKTKAHKGYDNRAENPRLDEEYYRSKDQKSGIPHDSRFHTHRSHGSMYRQAMPFISGEDQGLYFICFSRSLAEIDNSIKRMAGHFQKDGSTDAVLDITTSITNNYYYCPSIQELKNLRKNDLILTPNEDVEIQTSNDDKLKIVAEYCTNCGYFTIYQKVKQIIESVCPDVVFIENPKNPRLASFEISTEDGELLFSKLALPDGMNNYPHCFPTSAGLKTKLYKYLKQPVPKFDDSEKNPIVWGLSGWEDIEEKSEKS
jgi:putative iron-dependent peroxidase